jgi:WD40 repeat protein
MEPQLGDEGTPSFVVIGRHAKSHDRIIWSVAWAPCGDMFATGSRDKVLKLWLFDGSAPAAPAKPAAVVSGLRAAVTALAFAPRRSATGGNVLAVGMENGDVEIFSVQVDGSAGAVHRVRAHMHHDTTN